MVTGHRPDARELCGASSLRRGEVLDRSSSPLHGARLRRPHRAPPAAHVAFSRAQTFDASSLCMSRFSNACTASPRYHGIRGLPGSHCLAYRRVGADGRGGLLVWVRHRSMPRTELRLSPLRCSAHCPGLLWGPLHCTVALKFRLTTAALAAHSSKVLLTSDVPTPPKSDIKSYRGAHRCEIKIVIRDQRGGP